MITVLNGGKKVKAQIMFPSQMFFSLYSYAHWKSNRGRVMKQEDLDPHEKQIGGFRWHHKIAIEYIDLVYLKIMRFYSSWVIKYQFRARANFLRFVSVYRQFLLWQTNRPRWPGFLGWCVRDGECGRRLNGFYPEHQWTKNFLLSQDICIIRSF